MRGEKKKGSLEKDKIVMSYDREADTVSISFGKPRKAVSEEVDPYVVVRRDPKTREMVGITITNFSKYFEIKKNLSIEIPT